MKEGRIVPELLFKEESYKIIGACFEVYNSKGNGFTEPIYHDCLEVEFAYQRIPAIREPKVEIEYRGKVISSHLEPDFVCYGKIIVELKSVSGLCDEHRSQVLNYLNATGFQLGLLVNFGSHPKLEYERLALSRPWS